MSSPIELLLSVLATYLVCSTFMGVPLLWLRRSFGRASTRVWLCRAALFLPILVVAVLIVAAGREPLRLTAGSSHVDVPLTGHPKGSRMLVTRGGGGLEYSVYDADGRVIAEPNTLTRPGTQLLAGIAGVWFAGVLVMSVRLLRAVRAHRQALEGRIRIAGPHFSDALLTSSAIRLSVTERITGPMVTAGGEVCVPLRIFDELPNEVHRAILAHEVAHVKRRDPVWSIAAELLAIAAWFQPIVWMASRSARREAELAADDFASQHADPAALAEGLASVAEWGHVPTLGTAAAADGAHLVTRIERLLDRAPDAPSRTWLAALVVFSLVAFAIATLPPVTIATPDRWNVRIGQGPLLVVPR